MFPINKGLLQHKNFIFTIIFFFLIYSSHSIAKHLAMQSQAFDMGVYNQYFWLLKNNQTPFSTLNSNHLFANHFEIILLALIPIYKLYPDSTTLLIIQSLFTVFSAYPIYLLARKYLFSQLEIFICLIAYLSSIGILYAINYDFHTSTISLLPIAWLIYFTDSKKYKFLFFTSIIALLFKEDQIYFVLILGVYLLLQKKFKIGLSLLLLSICTNIFIYSYFSQKYILEVNEHTIISHRANINVQKFVQEPQHVFQPTEKLFLPLVIYSEYLFLPLLNLLSSITTLPHIFLRLLSEKPSYWQIHWHYNANIQPFLIFGMITTFSKFKFIQIRKALFLIIAMLSFLRILHLALIPTFSNISISLETSKSLKYLSSIPSKYSIATDYFTNPHVSGREILFLCPNAPINRVEYIIIDKRLANSPCKHILNEMYTTEYEDNIIQVHRKKIIL